MKIAKDGAVYACDRQNDRIQVFQKDGKFVKEGFHLEDDDRRRIGMGHRVLPRSAAELVVHRRRPRQRVLKNINRNTLEVLGSFGDGGRLPGYFYGDGSIAVDSKGNVYTGETYEGKRVQKFVNKGR